jgi:transposase
VLRRLSQRREVSSIVLLTWTGRLHARHFAGTVRQPEVIAALAYFRRRVGRRLLIVWDHARTHSGWFVRRFLARHARDFAVAWLPGYAPELNPEEQCNGHVKRALLNALPDSVEELRRQVRGRFVALGRRPAVLHGFFRHAGLDVT